MGYLLGIDAGTTTIKATLFNEEGGDLTSTAIDCAVPYMEADVVEIKMKQYWETCKKCIWAIIRESNIDFKDIKALAISSQGVTFVPIDREGRELRKGIVFYDTRAKLEARELVHRFGEDRLYKITGQPSISAIFEAPKIMWIRRNEPDCFRDIHKILLVHDYIVFKLTGKCMSVPPLMSSSLLFDIRQNKWWEEMLDSLQLSPEKLPQIWKPGEPVEYIAREVSSETGLSTKTLVVAGAIDQICGMIGMGHIHPGLISESTGSVLAVHTISNSPFENKDAGIYNFCNVINDTYVLMGICPTAGTVLEWFKETFCEKERERAVELKSNVFDLITEGAQDVDAGSDGLIMLPYLIGRGSPEPNSLARGVYYGFKLHHKKEHFVRALLESIAYMLKDIIRVFKKNGLDVEEIRSFGGGSQSKLWNQIKADVCGVPVITSGIPEPGCLGAAILAGVGSSIFKNIENGCKRLVLLKKPIYPDEEKSRRYDEYYKEYTRLNKMIETMFSSDQE